MKKLFPLIMTICLITTTHASTTYESRFPLKVGEDILLISIWQLKNVDTNNHSISNAKNAKGILLMSNKRALSHYANPLAEAGYLVGAFSHKETVFNFISGKTKSDPMLGETHYINHLLTAIREKTPSTKNLPVGVLGYSLGVYSTLVTTGNEPQFTNQSDYCHSEIGKKNVIICNPRFSSRVVDILRGKNKWSEPIKANAVVLLAPAYLPLIRKTEQSPPTLLIYGELDEYINPKEVEAFVNKDQTFEMHKLKDIGHYAYLSVCKEDKEIYQDPKPIDREKKHAEILKQLVTFFNKHLAKA